MTEFMTAYSPRHRVQIEFAEKGMTKQSFAKECDINNIMARYQKTGAVSHFSSHQGEYGFASGLTFTEAMMTVTKAQQLFAGLPSKVRNRCGNDPAYFLDFVQDEANAVELVELGLMDRPDVVEAGAPDTAVEAVEEAQQPPAGPPEATPKA